MTNDETQRLLRQMLDAAIEAANPATVLEHHLPEKPKGRCIVVGAGKSSAAMARAVEHAWPDVDLSGIVVTRYGHSVATDRIIVREASHPVPDVAGERATKEIMNIVKSAGPDDLVLALISGGGSALLTQPKPPMTLGEKIKVNQLLLKSGLSIKDMNRLRRRLSLVKGGALARLAAPAHLVTLAISDVPGDEPAMIASGPTMPDPTAKEDLSDLVAKLGPLLPQSARTILLSLAVEQSVFSSDYRLIAAPQQSLEAAAKIARDAGITPILLGDRIEGEARELGIVMGGIALATAVQHTSFTGPVVLLSGGETTVTISDEGYGRGGRNTEFLLSLAITIEGHPRIHALAADTDGIDGTEDAAGAIIGPGFTATAHHFGLNPSNFLTRHDSYTFFNQIDSLIRTGPTLTNVNDFRAILVL
jgi:glycerate 2-kinase